MSRHGSSIKDIRGHRHLSDFIPKPKKCEDVDSYVLCHNLFQDIIFTIIVKSVYVYNIKLMHSVT